MSSRLYPRWTPNFRRCAVGVAAGHMEMWPDCGCGTLTGAPHSAPRAPDFEAVPGQQSAVVIIGGQRIAWAVVAGAICFPYRRAQTQRRSAGKRQARGKSALQTDVGAVASRCPRV